MRKLLFPGLVGLLLLVLAACGSSATAVPAAKQAPAAPAAVAAPAAPAAVAAPAAPAAPAAVAKPAAPAAVAAPAVSPALAAYAAKVSGGPGAIYLGDIKQLVGLAATKEEGGLQGEVPLDALTRHLYIYNSPYYKGMLEKAKLDNPTKLVSTGQKITIQHTCINRTLLHCAIVASYWAPNLEKRTNGQLKLTISSLPELGLGGPDTLRLVQDGTLAMADVYSGFVAGDLPAIEIQSLWGMFPDQRAQYEVTVAVTPDLEKLVKDATGGSFIINHNWVAGIDQFFFCNTKILTLADFKGKKTRSHGTAISDWIEGMGASAQFVPFGDVYTALERGILDCGVTGATPAHGQRWYEVSKYINGPLVSFFNTNNVINKDVWNKIPSDLQQIMIEEGAKSELEGMRLASIQNETGVLKLQAAGMELVEFSQELKDYSYNNAVLGRVLPNWVKRVGGPASQWAKIFNEKATPVVGLRIEPDGKIAKVPVTKVR